MRRILIYTAIVMSFSSTIMSQDIQIRVWNDTAYQAAINFPPEGVADDFGPRLAGGQHFHLGIDYNVNCVGTNCDKWDLILAPEDGDIVDVNRLWTDDFTYKQLCYQAGDHRYVFGHVYDNDSIDYSLASNGIYLKGMIGEDDDKWAQIIIIDTDTFIYGQVIGQVVFEGDTLNTTTEVNSGDPLVPLGESDAEDAAHLHLNTIPLSENHSTGSTYHNCNPLQYINYEAPDKTIDLFCREDSTEFRFKYPGTDLSTIASKVSMDDNTVIQANGKRFSDIFDVDKVKWHAKNDSYGEQYSLIRGPWWSSEIIYGGTLDEDLYGHQAARFFDDKTEWWDYTGVDSYAYNDDGAREDEDNFYFDKPYDVFHYSDWVTRIHMDDDFSQGNESIADIPLNALYKDGTYSLRAQETNIRNAVINAEIEDVILDNFIPYITQVDVNFGGNRIYTLTRTGDEGTLTMANDGMVSCVEDNESATVPQYGMLTVTVTTSEVMDTLTMDIPKLSQTDLVPTSTNNVHVFQVTDSLFRPGDLCLNLVFKGSDTNGNKIYNVSGGTAGNTMGSVSIPTRVDTGGMATAWLPNYEDHNIDSLSFCVSTCERGNIISNEDFIHKSSNNCIDINSLETEIQNASCNNNDGSITLSEPNSFYGLSFTWTDESGQHLSQYDDQYDISGLSAGVYCYQICGEGCRVSACVTVGQYILPSEINLIVHDAQNSIYSYADITMADGLGPYSVIWKNSIQQVLAESLVGTTDMSPDNLEIGTEYCVEVINRLGCTHQECFTIQGSNCSEYYSVLLSQLKHSTCQTNDGAIEISIDENNTPDCLLEEGYYIEWDQDNNGHRIEGIAGGEYCVTITNLNTESCEDCYTVACYEVECLCEGVVIDIPDPVINLSSCGSNDGSILFRAPIRGGTRPYSFLWNTGQTESWLFGLSEGTYILTVTDANGCTAMKEVLLYSEDTPQLLDHTVEEPCINGRDGTLAILIGNNNNAHQSQFSYQWNTGDIRNVINVSAGNYTVTVTELSSGCSNSFDFEVNNRAHFGDLFVSEYNIEKTCPLTNTGSIEVTYGGGSPGFNSFSGLEPRYLFSWSNGVSGFNTSIIDNLSSGTYTVTVTDECGNEAKESYTIKQYELSISSDIDIACDNNSSIDLHVIGDNPPFNYNWSNGITSENLSDVGSGEYSVTVTDNLGCTKEHDVELVSIDYQIETLVSPCQNLNDGVINVIINNPFREEVTLTLNGLNYISSNDIRIEHMISDIISDFSNSIVLTIGDCEFVEEFVIESQPLEEEFSRYQENPLLGGGMCVYNLVCNGVVIEEDVVIRDPIIDLNSVESGTGVEFSIFPPFLNIRSYCRASISCPRNEGEVAFSDLPIESGPWIELALQQEIAFGFGDPGAYHEPCKDVRWCSGNLQRVGLGIAIGGSEGTYLPIPGLPGCYQLQCNSIFQTFGDFCIDVSDCGNCTDGVPFSDCVFYSMNGAQLLLLLDDTNAPAEKQRALRESTLGEFLETHRDDPRMNCQQIKFCANNFEYISDNLDFSNCRPLSREEAGVMHSFLKSQINIGIGVDDFLSQVNNSCDIYMYEGITYSVCPGNCPDICPIVTVLDNRGNAFFWDIFYNFSPDEEIDYTYFDSDKCEEIIEYKTSLVHSGGSISPVLLYKTASERQYVLEFDNEGIFSPIGINESVSDYIYDFDNAEELWLFEQDVNSYEAYFNGIEDGVSNSNPIEANLLFDVEFLNSADLNFISSSQYITGNYTGELSYGDDIILSSSEVSSFILEINNEGELLSSISINDINIEKGVHFELINNKIYFIAFPERNLIEVNGVDIGVRRNSYTLFSINDSNVQFVENIRLGSEMKIDKFIISKDERNIVYIADGKGQVQINTLDRINTETTNSIITTSRGRINFSDSYSITSDSNIEVAYTNQNSLIVGLTGNSSTLFTNQDVGPNQDNNIILLKYSLTGNLLDNQEFGAHAADEIGGLIIQDGIIYFSGLISIPPSETSVVIGKKRYYTNTDCHDQIPFISYLNDCVDYFQSSLNDNCVDNCDCMISDISSEDGCQLSFDIDGEGCSNYELVVTGPNKFSYRSSKIITGRFDIDNIISEGEFEIKLLPVTSNCNDSDTKLANVIECNEPVQICQNINNSVTGIGDYSSSFVSDGDGYLRLEFNTVRVPDQLIVTLNGTEVVNSGHYSSIYCQSTVDILYPTCRAIGGNPDCDSRTYPFIFDLVIEKNDIIEIEIVANNCDAFDTVWYLDANCSGPTMSNKSSVYTTNYSSLGKTKQFEKALNYELKDGLESDKVIVYPNPTNSILLIEYNGELSTNSIVELYDMSQKLVYKNSFESEKITIDVEDYPPGVYILVFNSHDVTIQEKIVIAR